MVRSGAVWLLLVLCTVALTVRAFDLQRSAEDLSPDPISFAQYVQRRSLGLHAAPEQRFAARMHAKRQQQQQAEDSGADESLESLSDPPTPSPNAVHITILHINDLYELIPSGTLGGVSRLGTVLRQLESLNPNNTLSVLAGDLFSPSALSTVPINGGPPLLGKQMVATMNALGLSAATIGNHETDVHSTDFAARLDESLFPWICVNARNSGYEHLGATAVDNYSNRQSPPLTAKLGLFGLTLDSNNKPYMSFDNFTTSLATAARTVADMRAEVDVLVALTHLPYWHDETLAQTVAGIDLIAGGHEHKRIQIESPGLPGIYKADSNVASTWIHDIFIDPSLPLGSPQRLVIQSVLVSIDASIVPDPALDAVVQSWIAQGFAGFEAARFSPAAFLATPSVDLVGNNDVIFAQATALTEIFNLAVMDQGASYDPAHYNFTMPLAGPDLSLFNAGAIRIDDTILAGQSMIQYDAIRISPYLNSAALINVTGAILQRTLDAGMSRQNNSQYLHFYPNVTALPSATASSGFTYQVNGRALSNSNSSWYLVSVLGFLLQGAAPYEFLQPSAANTGVLQVVAWDQSGASDVRRSVIAQIADMFPGPPTPTTGGAGSNGPEKILGMSELAFVLLMLAILLCVVLAAVTCVRRGAATRGSFEAGKRRADTGRAYLDLEGGDVSMPGSSINDTQQRREAALLQHQYNASARMDAAMYAHDQ